MCRFQSGCTPMQQTPVPQVGTIESSHLSTDQAGTFFCQAMLLCFPVKHSISRNGKVCLQGWIEQHGGWMRRNFAPVNLHNMHLCPLFKPYNPNPPWLLSTSQDEDLRLISCVPLDPPPGRAKKQPAPSKDAAATPAAAAVVGSIATPTAATKQPAAGMKGAASGSGHQPKTDSRGKRIAFGAWCDNCEEV